MLRVRQPPPCPGVGLSTEDIPVPTTAPFTHCHHQLHLLTAVSTRLASLYSTVCIRDAISTPTAIIPG